MCFGRMIGVSCIKKDGSSAATSVGVKNMFLQLLYSKPVLNGHSKIYKTQVLMTTCSLMKVESIT